MSNLFTAVSVEQQEIVAGGLIVNLQATRFLQQQNVAAGKTTSGPNGSTSEGLALFDLVNTRATNFQFIAP
jgi:ribosomal protein L27